MTAKLGEYKGHKTISLEEEGLIYPFSFGLNKAEAIISNLEAIQKFVTDNQPKLDNQFK